MKKTALLMALIMLFSCVSFAGLAEDSAIQESASGFYYIEAAGDRPRLSAADPALFIQADGEWFKDLNKNGALDVYEDWRVDIDTRVADLLSQMTLLEKTGTLGFGGISAKHGTVVSDFGSAVGGGQTGVTYLTVECPQMDGEEDLVVVDDITYMPVNYQIKNMSVTTFVTALTGYPKDQLDVMNKVQKISEESRLGIPSVFSGDRTYNTWGGMIDAAHYSFGVAHDPELLYALYSRYAQESVALGYHQVFHGYGNEIGSWYGDNPSYIAEMSALETHAYEDNNFSAHSKHFLARGGRNSYVNAKSPADLIDSWMIGWKAVVDAGTSYIMTNNNVGVTPGLQGYMDKDTYDILRVDLGYDGVVCLDWPLDSDSLMQRTGVTSDGIDVSTLTLGEKYVLILNAGVDMISCSSAVPGTDISAYKGQISWRYFPETIIAEIEAGKYTEEALDVHVARVLKNKFDLGIFENPFRDWDEAVELIGTDLLKADPNVTPMSIDEINLYRKSDVKEMEDRLMIESTVMLKNDGILPLQPGVKLYVATNNTNIDAADKSALPEKATVVDKIDDADVVIIHVSSFNDAYELLVEDAQDAEKPYILIFEGPVGRNGAQGEPYFEQLAPASAVLLQTYNNTPDHGSSVGSFYRYVSPEITAGILFGEIDPAGTLVFEVPYEAEQTRVSWGELQNDIGVDNKTRLFMAMTVKENPETELPRNLGDVLFTADYGMTYANPADITLSLLTVERESVTVINPNNGRASTTVRNKVQKAGDPFEIDFVAKNNGGAGHITVQVLDGETVVAEKFVALAEGQWRVISLDIALEAGEHTITVGDMTAQIVVE